MTRMGADPALTAGRARSLASSRIWAMVTRRLAIDFGLILRLVAGDRFPDLAAVDRRFSAVVGSVPGTCELGTVAALAATLLFRGNDGSPLVITCSLENPVLSGSSVLYPSGAGAITFPASEVMKQLPAPLPQPHRQHSTLYRRE